MEPEQASAAIQVTIQECGFRLVNFAIGVIIREGLDVVPCRPMEDNR